jgi:hypothetical protein
VISEANVDGTYDILYDDGDTDKALKRIYVSTRAPGKDHVCEKCQIVLRTEHATCEHCQFDPKEANSRDDLLSSTGSDDEAPMQEEEHHDENNHNAADAARRESADDSSSSDNEASSEDTLRAQLQHLNAELDSNKTELESSLSFLTETDIAPQLGPYAATSTTAFQSTLNKCFRLKATRAQTLSLVAAHKARLNAAGFYAHVRATKASESEMEVNAAGSGGDSDIDVFEQDGLRKGRQGKELQRIRIRAQIKSVTQQLAILEREKLDGQPPPAVNYVGCGRRPESCRRCRQ